MTARSLFITVLLGVNATLAAPPNESAFFSVDEATTAALRDNARLRSLRAAVAAAEERPVQAASLPNPTMTFGEMDSTGRSVGSDASQQRVSLQQTFPWFGKRRLREQIAAKEAEGAGHALNAAVRDVRMRVRQTYYDLYAQQQVIALTRAEVDVLTRIAEIAKTLYAAGSREQTDLIQAQTEQTRLRQRLIELRARETTLKARLNALLDRRPDTPFPTLSPPPVPVLPPASPTAYESAATNSPDVLAAQTQADRYALQERLNAKESAPDYRLGLEYRELHENDDMMMVTIGVDLPIWFDRIRAGVREASKMRESSLAARDDARVQNAFDMDDARAKYEAAERTLTLTRQELLPQAEARLNAHEAAYRNGTADFLDVLESERFRLDTQMMEIRAEAERGMQAARFERAAGILSGP